MIEDVLKSYGLNDKEVDIYIRCLELGQAPVSSIARQVHLNRVTVYSILKKLNEKGLIQTTTKKKVTYYSAVAPEILLKNLETRYEQFKEVLPQLQALSHKYDNTPKVRLYEGFESLKMLYSEIVLASKEMEEGQPFLTFTGGSDIDPKFEEYLSGEFKDWRLKFPIKTKSILTNTKNAYNSYTKKNHEYIVIDEDLFAMGNEIIIYGKSQVAVLMYTPQEMLGLMIDSSTLHQGMTSLFNLIWRAYK